MTLSRRIKSKQNVQRGSTVRTVSRFRAGPFTFSIARGGEIGPLEVEQRNSARRSSGHRIFSDLIHSILSPGKSVAKLFSVNVGREGRVQLVGWVRHSGKHLELDPKSWSAARKAVTKLVQKAYEHPEIAVTQFLLFFPSLEFELTGLFTPGDDANGASIDEGATSHAITFDNADVPVVPSLPQTSGGAMSGTRRTDSQDRGVLADLPEDYPVYFKAASELRHHFHTELAAGLQTRLNRHLQGMAQETYDEKRALATWVNEQLRSLGLAIKCPKTGRPGSLLADFKDSEGDVSRFRLEVRDEHGGKTRIVVGRHLAELELMEDAPRQEPLAGWARKARAEAKGRPGRA